MLWRMSRSTSVSVDPKRCMLAVETSACKAEVSKRNVFVCLPTCLSGGGGGEGMLLFKWKFLRCGLKHQGSCLYNDSFDNIVLTVFDKAHKFEVCAVRNMHRLDVAMSFRNNRCETKLHRWLGTQSRYAVLLPSS